MKLYKVLNKDLTSPYQAFKFMVGVKYHCDNFDDDKNKGCSNGFYAVDIDGLPYCFNIHRKVFEVQVTGRSVEINQYKRRYENIKIIRECEFNEIKTKALKLEKKLGYKLSEVLFPVNPLEIGKQRITKEHLELLKQWDSVWASVRDSVWDSVGDSVWDSARDSVWASVRDSVWDSVWASVRDSVRDSVWASVRDSVWDGVGDSVWASVRDSVWDSVGAYMSSFFPHIKKWKYIEHKEGVNPYKPCIDLWHMGIVPSYDGKLWRLHSGKKADIIWEGKA